MAVSGFWLSLLSRLGLAHRDGHCYWFFTGIDRCGSSGVRRVEMPLLGLLGSLLKRSRSSGSFVEIPGKVVWEKTAS